MRALDRYNPGRIAKLTGAAKKEQARLEAELARAERDDEYENERLLAEHAASAAEFSEFQNLARGVLSLDPPALESAIDPIREQEDFEALGLEIHVVAVEQDAAAIDCILNDDEVVPSELIGLTATGKLSTKKMPKSRYWDVFQDFVCSCAIRLAGEAFAMLPISRTVVNISRCTLDTSTGHQVTNVLLGVHITRSALSAINLSAIDPSDSMVNFGHRMDFKKTTGFKPVEPVRLSENWART